MAPEPNSPHEQIKSIGLPAGVSPTATGGLPLWEVDLEAPSWRRTLKRSTPRALISAYRAVRRPRDPLSVARFVIGPVGETSIGERLRLARKIHAIQQSVHCMHYQHEIIAFFEAALSPPKAVEGCLVEAGCYKGGGTAKFSLAAKLAGRELVAFDSFEGIPDNQEPHDKDIWGYDSAFPGGSWAGTLPEVKSCVEKWGEIDMCKFVQGWFEDTMPEFTQPVVVAYLDVDLASSTRTCLKHLYPLIAPGGIVLSQDGHIPLVLDVFNDEAFWRDEVGVAKPEIEKFGHKLLRIVKPVG
jgi:O-methyltransferase